MQPNILYLSNLANETVSISQCLYAKKGYVTYL